LRRLADGSDAWSADSVRQILDALIVAMEGVEEWKAMAADAAATALTIDSESMENWERSERFRFMAAGWRRLAAAPRAYRGNRGSWKLRAIAMSDECYFLRNERDENATIANLAMATGLAEREELWRQLQRARDAATGNMRAHDAVSADRDSLRAELDVVRAELNRQRDCAGCGDSARPDEERACLIDRLEATRAELVKLREVAKALVDEAPLLGPFNMVCVVDPKKVDALRAALGGG
jgi:hypothetical protein